MKITDAQISSAYRASPKKVQELIEEGVVASLVESFFVRFSLTEEQGTTLGLSLRNALIGLASPRDVETELVERGVSKEVMEKIIIEAKEKLFGTIEHTKEAVSRTPAANASLSVPPDHLLPPHVEPETSQSAKKPLSAVLPVSVVSKPITTPEPAHPRTMASDVEAMQGGGKPTAPRPITQPRPVAPPRPVPPPTVTAVQDDLKKYGIDPYREPIQ